MSDFRINRPEPFTVEGVDGTVYELPRIKDMSADQIAALGSVSAAKDDNAAQVRAQKEFILGLCPDLADEPLADMGYVYLFKALAEGSGIELGEF